jgi:hypothetical protein
MKYRPSAWLTLSYEVPDGTWTATTVAPGTTPPCESLTTPVIEAVVTPCAAARVTGHAHRTHATRTSAFFIFFS